MKEKEDGEVRDGGAAWEEGSKEGDCGRRKAEKWGREKLSGTSSSNSRTH